MTLSKRLRVLCEYARLAEEACTATEKAGFAEEGVCAALPLAYRFLSEQNFMEDHIVAAVGHYLGRRYPHLRGYFVTSGQKKTAEEMRRTIESFFEGEP